MSPATKNTWSILGQIVAVVVALAGAFIWASSVDTKAAVQEERITNIKNEQEKRWNEIREDIKEIKEMIKEARGKR